MSIFLNNTIDSILFEYWVKESNYPNRKKYGKLQQTIIKPNRKYIMNSINDCYYIFINTNLICTIENNKILVNDTNYTCEIDENNMCILEEKLFENLEEKIF
jgi:hypothetical protein